VWGECPGQEVAPALLEGEAEGVDDPRLTDEHVPNGGPSQGPGDAGRGGAGGGDLARPKRGRWGKE